MGVLRFATLAILLTGVLASSSDNEASNGNIGAVINLDKEEFTTTINDTVSVTIKLVGLRETETCHVVSPDGVEHDIMEDSVFPGVNKVEGHLVSCGVSVEVFKEEFVGDWVLISKERSMGSDVVERRLPFTINVEETVKALPSHNVKILEGSDFYIRLEQPTEQFDTCSLIGPSLNDSKVQKDTHLINYCGFIVKNVEATDSGTWEIRYGSKIVYRASVRLDVHGSTVVNSEYITLAKNEPIDLIMGPEEAVYCRIEDPTGRIAYEDFGRCQLSLARVTDEHSGVWVYHVGHPGRVYTTAYQLTVALVGSAVKPLVTSQVTKVNMEVDILCSVTTPYPIKACKLMDANGKIFLANPGVGEDGYSFAGAGTSTASGMYTHECGIHISSPVVDNLGLWRCAIESDQETYYGFVNVECPWVGDVSGEPVLAANRDDVTSVEGDDVTLSCHIQSAIKYCYFRAQNGSIFPVGPDTSSHNYMYAGAGFDAGDCSIKFSSLGARDTGRWSCHVGFADHQEPEQRMNINLNVQKKVTVNQYSSGSALIVEGHVYGPHAVDYCRFVRIDGAGFTSDALPAGYSFIGSKASGVCSLRVTSPTILDHHPWTVVAKIANHNEEIFGETEHTLEWPSAEEVDAIIAGGGGRGVHFHIFYCFLLPLIVVTSLIAFCVYRPTRKWGSERATIIRDSFRRSFAKKEIEVLEPEKQTPFAA